MVSWLSPNKMGIRAILQALQLAGSMSIQIIAVCACAGLIVGVIALTGVGARFSSLLLGLAGVSQLLALFFAMCISILLGMGMPTTAAYAVAASVVAPGLIEIGIQPLVATSSCSTSPWSRRSPRRWRLPPMRRRASPATAPWALRWLRSRSAWPRSSCLHVLLQPGNADGGSWMQILRVGVTATLGIVLLSATVQAWFFGPVKAWQRIVMLIGALCMIYGG